MAEIFVIFGYFALSWFFPWKIIPWTQNFSITYCLDILVCFVVWFYFKKRPRFSLNFNATFFKHSLPFLILAAFVVNLLRYIGFVTPFKMIPNYSFHLLWTAPILEEFLFRFSFLELMKNKIKNNAIVMGLNGLVFSLAHLYSIRFFEPLFHSFFYLQTIYTFVLGVMLANIYLKKNQILDCIYYHFIFNFLFWLALKLNLIT